LNLSNKEVAAVRRRIKLGLEYNRKELKDDFKESLDLYLGEQYPDLGKTSKRARVIVNYVLNAAETSVDRVAFQYPDFTVKPRTPDGEGQEPILKSAVEYSWDEGRIQKEMRRGWKDKFIYGTGIIYTGWLFTTYDGMRLENGRETTELDGGDTTPNPTDGWEQIESAKVRDDRFLAKRINPGSFFVSPEAGRDLEEAEYCGYIEVRSLEEVKANPYYKNTKQLKGTTYNLQPWFDERMVQDYCSEDSEEKIPSDIKRVTLWHYYEKRRRLHLVMCDEHEKPLLTEAWTWQHDRYPFRVRQNPGDEDCFWGLPGPLMIRHQQREINEARSQLSDHRRRFGPKFQVPQGVLNNKARAAIKSEDAGEVVEHSASELAPIQPINMPNVQPEVYSTEQQVVSDIQTVLGLNPYEMGKAPTKRTPTAEVQAIQSQGGARAQAEQQAFETWCAEVAKDCIDWLKMYSVKTRQLPIYDDQSVLQGWHDFTGDQIKGDFDVSVYVGSTTPPNNQARLESLGFFLQSLNPLLQEIAPAMQVGINLIPLVRQLMSALPEVRDTNQIFVGPPAPPPMGGMPGEPQQPGMGGPQLDFPPVDDRLQPQQNGPDLLTFLQGQ